MANPDNNNARTTSTSVQTSATLPSQAQIDTESTDVYQSHMDVPPSAYADLSASTALSVPSVPTDLQTRSQPGWNSAGGSTSTGGVTTFFNGGSEYAPKNSYAYIVRKGMKGNVTAYRCIEEISSKVSSISYELLKLNEQGTTEGSQADEVKPITNNRDINKLFRRVSPSTSFSEFIENVTVDLLIYGEAYVLAQVDGGGKIHRFQTLRPDLVKTNTDQHGDPVTYEFKPSKAEPMIYRAFPHDESREHYRNQDWVKCIKFRDPLSNTKGFGPLQVAIREIDFLNHWGDHRINTLANAGMPSGLFTVESIVVNNELKSADASHITKTQEIVRELIKPQNSGKPGVAAGNIKFQPIAMKPKELDFNGAVPDAITQIATAFKIPSELVGGPKTYNNVEQAIEYLWRSNIIPTAKRIMTELVEVILPVYGLEQYDVRLAVDDIPALVEFRRLEAIAKEIEVKTILMQVRDGIITPNEARTKLGETPSSDPSANTLRYDSLSIADMSELPGTPPVDPDSGTSAG